MNKIKSYVLLFSGFWGCMNAYATCPTLGNTLYVSTGATTDSDCIVSVLSYNGFGIVVNANSQYTSINGTVSTNGDGGYGITVVGNNASMIAHGLVVNTTGSYVPNHYALGMFIQNGTSVTIDDRVNTNRASSISTSGLGSSAIVLAPNSTLNIHGGNNSAFIGTSGNNANAIQMETATTVTTDNLRIETSGNNSHGIDIYYGVGLSSGIYNGTKNTLKTTGDNSNIFMYERGGNITLQDSLLTTSGINAYGMSNGSGVNPNNLTLNHSILETAQSTVFYLTGTALSTINLNDGTQVRAGNGILMNAYTNANIALNATNAVVLNGDVLADNTSTVNMSLINSSWTGAAQQVTNLALNSSQWMLTATSNITGMLVNGGTVFFGASEPFKTVTTTDYTGNNGVLRMRTALNSDDNSPSDRLIVDGGTASGTTNIRIENKGGIGAHTKANGILIVDAINGAVTDPTAFTQSTPAVAGPYKYVLYRGNLDNSLPDNWYLRSQLIIDPVNPDDRDPLVQEFRRKISLYNSILPMAAIYGRQMIDSLHQRVGDEEMLRGRSELGTDHFTNGVWARVVGLHGRWRGNYYGPYQGAPESKFEFGAGQLGMDLYRNEEKEGQRNHIGIYGAYGQSTEHLHHRGMQDTYVGSSQFNAYSLAGYWTHFGASGWYVDGVVQGTFYDNKVQINHAAIPNLIGQSGRVTPDEWGIGLSLEGGYPIALSHSWIIEPQAQIVYQNIGLDGFNDGSAKVRFNDLDSGAARLGGRLLRNGVLNFGQKQKEYKAWLRANAWKEFNANPGLVFVTSDSPIVYNRSLKESWGQFGLGADVAINALCSLYGSVDYQSTFKNDTYTIEGKIGIRSNW